jgi:multidrug efflux pump subunit AcrA (membrane-fusion protein)
VTSGPLSSQTQVNATLGFTGSYSVVNQATGTFTWLPAAGQVIRQGGVLYRLDGSPVVLLYGRVPVYRNLAAGDKGADVRQLNRDLVALGYADETETADLGWDYFSAQTTDGLERLQEHLGVTQSGTLALGTAVMLPAEVRVTSVTGTLGAAAPQGQAVMQATSTTVAVTVPLNADLQTDVKTGDKVTVTLPDTSSTPGTVESVGTVATVNSSGTATISVRVALSDPAAVRHLDQAPVTVTITTASVSQALSVPVDALLAQAGGGYAVEVASGGTRHLVRVSVGLFDDAAGLVQVTGAGLSAGQHVVVPTL